MSAIKLTLEGGRHREFKIVPTEATLQFIMNVRKSLLSLFSNIYNTIFKKGLILSYYFQSYAI